MLCRPALLGLSMSLVAVHSYSQADDKTNADAFRTGSQGGQEFPLLLGEGFTRAVRSWDLALVGLVGLSFSRPEDANDKIGMRPLGVDQEISRSFSSNDKSLGSRVKPNAVAAHIFLGQLGVTAFLDLATDTRITSLDYERSFVFAKTVLYTFSITEITKNVTSRTRPDGSDDRAFFSGHASSSFAMSAYVYREFNHWVDGMTFARRSSAVTSLLKGTSFAACYGWATYVGYSRIHDRKHYLSDVVVGAAVGTVIGNLMYDWHFGTRAADDESSWQITLRPSSQPMVGLAYHF